MKLIRAIFYPFLSSNEKEKPMYDTFLGGIVFVLLIFIVPIVLTILFIR